MSDLIPNHRRVEVIISDCTADGLRVYGNQYRTRHASVETAMRQAEGEKAAETCVIVRPCYNEGESGKRFFREWRSINGAAFKEVRWDLPEFFGGD